MTPLTLGTLVVVALPALRAPADTVPLYDNLGNHHHAVTTRAASAQQYFDQGLRLVFGFNHGEAIRAFNEGARLDPSCAMCYWGAALASGPHVNAGMDSASGVAAYAAAQKALRLAARVSPHEQAYIRAVAKRYAPVPTAANRAALDSAYARAMAEVVQKYPDDLDAATLYAEALMDLRPWNYWKLRRASRIPARSRSCPSSSACCRPSPTTPAPATTTSTRSRPCSRRRPSPAPSGWRP